ncbi:MAG TPA: DUF58 domain-containing protein [Candidatus Kapabacteria bacterium]|nr:DUF58 domain-containing protein [Candidatus Kapabacteria bacterium]
MIVPSPILLWLAAVGAIPLLTLIGMGGNGAVLGGAGLLLLVLVAVVDVVMSRRELDDLVVLLPGRINMFKGRAAEVEVRFANPRKVSQEVRIGLNFPPSLSSDREDMQVQLPAAPQQAVVRWQCTPGERGSFRIPSVHLEAQTRFRLWNIRRHQRTNVEVRVYPDLFEERKRVAMIFLRRNAFGIHAQRQVGKGREFEKLRDYAHGDPLEDIHWKATAKRGRPVSKVYQVERTQEVYVVIDSSRLSARASGLLEGEEPDTQDGISTTVLDRFLTAGLLLGLATEQQGDHFGLVTFSDKVHSVIRAKNGHSHFSLCRDALFQLQPRLVTPDFDELFSTIRVRLRKRALVMVLTALDDPIIAESFLRGVDLVSRQHLVLVNMIEPGGTKPLFSRHAPEPQSVREVYDALAGHELWQKLRELEGMLGSRGVKFTVTGNELLTRELLGQYLEVKQRQIL